jgi:hypothetical protein
MLRTSATQYARCVDVLISSVLISRRVMVTIRAVITTRFERLITFASTTTIVGILMRGASMSMGIFPALSTDVVEKMSILKCRDAFAFVWTSNSSILIPNIVVVVFFVILPDAVVNSCTIVEICPRVARKNRTKENEMVNTNGVHSKSVRRGCCLGETVTRSHGAINGRTIENVTSKIVLIDEISSREFTNHILNMINAPDANMHDVTVNNLFPRNARPSSPPMYPLVVRVRITKILALCAIDIISNPDMNAVVGAGETVSIQ